MRTVIIYLLWVVFLYICVGIGAYIGRTKGGYTMRTVVVFLLWVVVICIAAGIGAHYGRTEGEQRGYVQGLRDGRIEMIAEYANRER